MKTNRLIILLSALSFLAFGARAYEDLTEMRVKSELNKILLRFLPQDEFIINVAGDYGQKTDEKLVEKEVVKERAPSVKVAPPTQPKQLPGFVVPAAPPAQPETKP